MRLIGGRQYLFETSSGKQLGHSATATTLDGDVEDAPSWQDVKALPTVQNRNKRSMV